MHKDDQYPLCADVERSMGAVKSKKDKIMLEKFKHKIETIISSNSILFESVEKEAIKNGKLPFNEWKALLLDGKLPESNLYKSRSEIQMMKESITDKTFDFDKALERLLKQAYREHTKIK